MSQIRVKRINYACDHTRTTSYPVSEARVQAEIKATGEFKALVVEWDDKGCDDCRQRTIVHGHPLRVPLHGIGRTSEGYRVAAAKILD